MENSAPFIVGLTGGIASGKSTVARLFEERGAELVDADRISRELVEKGTPALAAIVARFGSDILDHQGSLDRGKLRGVVFRDPGERRWLESLLHPRVREEIDRRIAAARAPYVILDVPLLLESNHYAFVDRILVVDLPETLQLERALRRDDRPREEIERIIAAQTSREERLRRADDVIDNSGLKEDLVREVERLDEFYRQQAQSRHQAG